MFKGKRTIAAGAIMALMAAGAYLMGDVPLDVALQRGLEGLTLIFLRLGIGNR